MENLVEVKDVNFAYEVRPVLKGINLQVPRGKVVSIMGLSGCGKTTLLRLIGGALMPTSGEVRVAGQVTHELDGEGLYALRRKMGMLFQFGALFTDMSAFDNVAFQMREHTELPESMIRDLALMALDAMLIMYDEPFAGLDPISLGVIGNLIRHLNDALGATTILVTHDVQESLKIVDYVYFMSEGVVVTHGTPEDIRNSHAPFVHQFVWGEMDGPVPFHYPGPGLARELGFG